MLQNEIFALQHYQLFFILLHLFLDFFDLHHNRYPKFLMTAKKRECVFYSFLLFEVIHSGLEQFGIQNVGDILIQSVDHALGMCHLA